MSICEKDLIGLSYLTCYHFTKRSVMEVWQFRPRTDMEAQMKALYKDPLAHMPGTPILFFLIPLFLQAVLMLQRQSQAVRMCRMCLIPFGLYFSWQAITCDFVPFSAFRCPNYIKNTAITIGILRTFEYGLLKDKLEWRGHSNNQIETSYPSAMGLCKSAVNLLTRFAKLARRVTPHTDEVLKLARHWVELG